MWIGSWLLLAVPYLFVLYWSTGGVFLPVQGPVGLNNSSSVTVVAVRFLFQLPVAILAHAESSGLLLLFVQQSLCGDSFVAACSSDVKLRPCGLVPAVLGCSADELLCCGHNSEVRMGWIGNSLSHLLLSLSSSLESVSLDQSTQGMVHASLQAFAFMMRELGHSLSMLVHDWHQVWLAQSHLTDPCRQTLNALPVLPEKLLGSTVLEADNIIVR
ncbi:hypothetical protein GOODEAATRI_027079 [Goodea atripinnis]|uniref:Secreted protein n=1 Tax=Goodea atripinnis TaxID=208336 RepID=A0ABV0P850_9TELE